MSEAYSPAAIVKLFEDPRGLQGHEVARLVSMFWPTIKDALLEYDRAHGGRKVAPRQIFLD